MSIRIWVGRRLGRNGVSRLIVLSAIIFWVVVFNMLTFRHQNQRSQEAEAPRAAVRHVAEQTVTQVVKVLKPGGEQKFMENVRKAVAKTSPEASPSVPVQNAPPPHDSSHAPLSCFTDRSTADQRSFNESEKAMFRYLFDWPEKPTSSCKKLIKLGGIAGGVGCLVDGDKYACLDRPLQLGTTKDCLVYSFGINYDWSFDEAAEMFGCEVHSFDPSIDYPEGHRSAGITFHHFGIGRNNHTNVYGWQIYTLDQIMRLLGHENRTVHYMKMDAEGGEFDMLAQQLIDSEGDFMMDKVEQIGFEIHYRLDPRLEMDYYLTVNETVNSMRQLGYNVAMWEYNKVVWHRYMFPGVDRPVSLLYEILLVKNGPDTWNRSRRGQRQAEANARATS